MKIPCRSPFLAAFVLLLLAAASRASERFELRLHPNFSIVHERSSCAPAHRPHFRPYLESGFAAHRAPVHRAQAHRSACGDDRIKLIGGYQRGKGTRPSGWHPREWFERRGYDLANYVHVHERSGAVHRGANVGRRGRH